MMRFNLKHKNEAVEMQELSLKFKGVEDTRRGGENCVDMERFERSKLEFLRRFMKREHGVPNRETLLRPVRRS